MNGQMSKIVNCLIHNCLILRFCQKKGVFQKVFSAVRAKWPFIEKETAFVVSNPENTCMATALPQLQHEGFTMFTQPDAVQVFLSQYD